MEIRKFKNEIHELKSQLDICNEEVRFKSNKSIVSVVSLNLFKLNRMALKRKRSKNVN